MNSESCDISSGGEDLFTGKFKFYKRKKPPPDFSSVLDFDAISEDTATVAGEKVSRFKLDSTVVGHLEGMKDIKDWKAYTIERLPGVIFIQNPFFPLYQRYWVARCLAEYPRRPNICNLDADPNVDRGEIGDIWQMAHASNAQSTYFNDLLLKLRWVTLGYHYNWTKKIYESSRWSSFPADLGDLTRCLALLTGYKDYNAEAAIVNFYHSDSSLGGHVDHSEFDKNAPLFSISFGQPAIFMVGGRTKQIDPIAMLLRSGDIVVLANSSRLAYHAVPRILSAADQHCVPETSRNNFNHPSDATANCTLGTDSVARQLDICIRYCSHTLCQVATCAWNAYERYLMDKRININVRQIVENGRMVEEFC